MFFGGPGTSEEPDVRWRGPCVVVARKSNGSIWCSYRGGLVKASAANLRLETPAERVAADLPANARRDAPPVEDVRGKRPCIDLSGQEPPPDGAETGLPLLNGGPLSRASASAGPSEGFLPAASLTRTSEDQTPLEVVDAQRCLSPPGPLSESAAELES